jgi:hypothetical protein
MANRPGQGRRHAFKQKINAQLSGRDEAQGVSSMSMEYRGWIEIPGLSYAREIEHERLFRVLLRDHLDLGPAMSWTDDGGATVVVLSTNAESRSSAIGEMTAAIADALRSSDLGNLSSSPSIVEPIFEDPAAATA